jgi:DNA-binding NarL/FixJ family response regulator
VFERAFAVQTASKLLALHSQISQMDTQIKIILADDHPIVRQGLKQIIEFDKNLSVVAEAGDGKTALDLIAEHAPQVAVLDIDMPELDGFSLVRALQKESVEIEVVFLTMHSEEEIFHEAMDLGVKGYVLKESAVSDIVTAIKSVAVDRPFLSPSLSMFLLNRRQRTSQLEAEKPGLHLLTATERRILKLIATDKTSKEIADELFISYRTVETHRTNISRKLELQGSLALIKFAIAHRSEL